ncbi:unnamed protein product [Sphagnum balticum]
MTGGLNGAAAGNRRAQGEQMSQWTNKSMRYRMKCFTLGCVWSYRNCICSHRDVKYTGGSGSLTLMGMQQIFHLLTQLSLFSLPFT